MRKAILLSLTLLMLVALVSPLLIQAQVPKLEEKTAGELGEMAGEAGYKQEKTLPEIIGGVIKIIISLLGIVAAIIIIIGGFQWMTSGGSEEKIKKAKGLMINGIIGLVLVVFAYAIATFVISSLSKVAE